MCSFLKTKFKIIITRGRERFEKKVSCLYATTFLPNSNDFRNHFLTKTQFQFCLHFIALSRALGRYWPLVSKARTADSGGILYQEVYFSKTARTQPKILPLVVGKAMGAFEIEHGLFFYTVL